MSEEAVRSWRDGGVVWVELNRPDRLNALNRAALAELIALLQAAVDDLETRVLLLTAAGERSFCAGADIAEMAMLDVDQIQDMMDTGKEATYLLERARCPVLAVVNGYALGGGCELALACDLILAAENAQFGLPEVDLAVLPGWGGSQRIERRVGYGRARDMLLTCRRVPAAEALQWGLCDRVFPGHALRDRASELAEVIAAKDQEALAAAKRVLRLRGELPLEEGLARETAAFVDLFHRPERATAMRRFAR